MLKQHIRDIKPIDFELMEAQIHALHTEEKNVIREYLERFTPDELAKVWSTVQGREEYYAGYRALNKPEMVAILVNNSEKWM